MPTGAEIKQAYDYIIKRVRCFDFDDTCSRLVQKWVKVNQILQRNLVLGLCLAFALTVSGCATSFSPRPIDEVPFKTRSKTQILGGLTVTAAVPTLEEAKAIYGVDLSSKGLQTVWSEVKTEENLPLIGPMATGGAFVVGALSGFGVMAAAAAGELAALHVTGAGLPQYASAFHPARYQDPGYLATLRAGAGDDGQL